MTISATKARSELYRLIDAAGDGPVLIVGKRKSAVLLSEDGWRATQETLCLLFIPGMRESIRKGLNIPAGKCKREQRW